jgi:hypothetical protein
MAGRFREFPIFAGRGIGVTPEAIPFLARRRNSDAPGIRSIRADMSFYH